MLIQYKTRGLLCKGLLLTLKAFLEGGSIHIFIHLRGIISRFVCLQKEFSIGETGENLELGLCKHIFLLKTNGTSFNWPTNTM
jgi:hypothetical protein